MEILWLDRLSYNSLLGTDQEGQLHDLQGPASTSQLQRDPFPKTSSFALSSPANDVLILRMQLVVWLFRVISAYFTPLT
jgi:hypothetical protein